MVYQNQSSLSALNRNRLKDRFHLGLVGGSLLGLFSCHYHLLLLNLTSEPALISIFVTSSYLSTLFNKVMEKHQGDHILFSNGQALCLHATAAVPSQNVHQF